MIASFICLEPWDPPKTKIVGFSLESCHLSNWSFLIFWDSADDNLDEAIISALIGIPDNLAFRHLPNFSLVLEKAMKISDANAAPNRLAQPGMAFAS